MIRSISLPLTLAVVLVSQLALAGCNKKEDVSTPPTDTAASAPDMSASIGAAWCVHASTLKGSRHTSQCACRCGRIA